jgi:recombination protein RecA
MAAKKVAKKRAVRKKPIEKAEKTTPLMAALLKRYGMEVIWTLEREKQPIEVIPLDLLGINWMLGRGGLPRGRIIEVFGKESNGKTTFCYKVIKCVQRRGGKSAIIDAETATDLVYMHQCGVYEDEGKSLIIAQPDYGEQALDMVEKLIESGEIDVIVVDSVAALIPRAELEATMSDMQVGLQARMMAKHMRRLSSKLKGSKTCVIFTNQLRDSIGGGFGKFKPGPTTPGGRALKHWASIRLSVQRTQTLKSGSREVGFLMKVKVFKNKVGPIRAPIEVPITYSYGLDERLDFMRLAELAHVISRQGSIYTLKGESKKKTAIGNGWLTAYKALRKSRRAMTYVKKRILAYLKKKGETDGDTEEESND